MTAPSQSPKVSVWMITYNHEKFIAQAIESVLMQQTNFDYELVIGEDCSTDGTRAIVEDYQQRYPDKIRALLHEKNIGAYENFARTFAACRGEYIAMLEGDDYWTDPLKLQKQVDYLDTRPECAACFHGIARLDFSSGQIAPVPFNDRKEACTLTDLLLIGNVGHTSSEMFRRQLFPECPAWFGKLAMGDFPMNILLAQQGRLGFIKESMSVKRIHSGGVWESCSIRINYQRFINAYRIIRQHLDPQYAYPIRQGMLYQRFLLAGGQVRSGQRWRAIGNYFRCLFSTVVHPDCPRRRICGYIVNTLSPRLLAWLLSMRKRLANLHD